VTLRFRILIIAILAAAATCGSYVVEQVKATSMNAPVGLTLPPGPSDRPVPHGMILDYSMPDRSQFVFVAELSSVGPFSIGVNNIALVAPKGGVTAIVPRADIRALAALPQLPLRGAAWAEGKRWSGTVNSKRPVIVAIRVPVGTCSLQFDAMRIDGSVFGFSKEFALPLLGNTVIVNPKASSCGEE
jgi:hypothetical protein